MTASKILVLPGSNRSGSVNMKLGHALVRAIEAKGATAQILEISSFDMPIYDGDLEQDGGVPEGAKKLAALICEHDGVVLVNPEYNGSMTPLMKNMLDWMSRDTGFKPYQKPVYALAASSPGALGGIRGINHVRDVLVSVGADTITPQLCVGGAGDAYDDSGDLKNERHQSLLQNLVNTLINRTR